MASKSDAKPVEVGEFMTIEAVAELWCSAVTTVRRVIDRGDLPVFRVPGTRRLLVKRVDALAAVRPAYGQGAAA